YCHYYFGDYYAPRYREIGIEPWLMFSRNRGCYDPLFHYYSWDSRRHGRGDWHRTLRDRYDFFAQHEDYRPAHTYADLRRQRFDRVRTGDINIDNNIQNIVVQQNNLAVNINQYVQNVERNVRIDGDRGDRRGRMRFARLGDEDRRRFVENARDIRGFQQRRSEFEREARVGDRGDRGERGQLARGDRGARRSLQLADFPSRQSDRDGGDRGNRRDGRGRDRARIAADVPPTPEQSAGRTGVPTGSAQDRTAGAGRDNRQGRVFERPGRADVTQDRDAVQDAIGGRGRARDQAEARESLRRQDDATRDQQRARDAVGRRGRGRDNDVELGRAGRDGPQFPSARIPGADREVTTQTPSGATTPPGGTSVTDPTGAGTTTNDRVEAIRRGRGARGDRTPGRDGFDSTDRRNGLNPGDPQRNEELRRRQQALRDELGIGDGQWRAERTRRGTVSGPSPRGRGDLRGGQNQLGGAVPDAGERGLQRGVRDRNNADLRNRQLPGRGDENRSPADPFRQRGDNRDARRSRGQLDEDATRRAAQSQQQEALRRQMEQLRERERSNRNNRPEQLLNERREARRQPEAAADAQPWNRQQFDRGRSGSDVSRGRGNERSAFRDAGRPDSDARRRALESLQNQQRQRPSPDFGQRGGQTRGVDATRMQRGAAGRADNDTRRQFRPDARSAFGGRGGGDASTESLQRSNRGRGDADASQQSNRGGGGRSASRQQEQSAPEANRAERRGDSGGEDRRGGRRGGRDRDRNDDD
ncbi:MAG TPA: hypothetical protein VHK01_09410, partial [Lacipirellulaceae bacterium]|nr:hypothetical protein [Lacipirellulaceae bacterium]